MLGYHSILMSPGRFPSLDGANSRPGHPKPRILTPRGDEAGAMALKEVRR